MKRKVDEITLYSDIGEVIHASIYRDVIDQSTHDGKSERLGIPEVKADNGEHINVKIDGDSLHFEKLSGEKLYLSPKD